MFTTRVCFTFVTCFMKARVGHLSDIVVHVRVYSMCGREGERGRKRKMSLCTVKRASEKENGPRWQVGHTVMTLQDVTVGITTVVGSVLMQNSQNVCLTPHHALKTCRKKHKDTLVLFTTAVYRHQLLQWNAQADCFKSFLNIYL